MKSSPSDNALKTAAEIAAYFNVDPRTILYWAQNGEIPVTFRRGRIMRFRLEDVLAANEVPPVNQPVMPEALAAGMGESKPVELAIIALSLLLGPEFPPDLPDRPRKPHRGECGGVEAAVRGV